MEMYKHGGNIMYKSFSLLSARILIISFILIGGFYLLKYSLPYLYPFLLAIILSFLLNPFVSILQKRFKVPRVLGTFIILTGFILLIIGLFFILFIEIYQGAIFLAEKIPGYFHTLIQILEYNFNEKILPLYEKVLSFFFSLDAANQEKIKENLDSFASYLAQSGANLLQETLSKIPNILSALPHSITVLIFIILSAFIITTDWEFLQQKLTNSLPAKINSSSKSVIIHLKDSLFGYVKAQIILISITGILIFIGLMILKIEHALTIAMFATLIDLIPFVGVGLIFIPWIIYLFFIGDYYLTIGLSVIYMIIIIVRQIIEPKIIASNIGLHPLVALIGYFIGIQIWGVVGLIIAPFILIIIYALYQAGVFRWIWLFIKG
mgnify:CR=1 FL=1